MARSKELDNMYHAFNMARITMLHSLGYYTTEIQNRDSPGYWFRSPESFRDEFTDKDGRFHCHLKYQPVNIVLLRQTYITAMVYLLTRDKGKDAAMLWKLSLRDAP